MLEPIGEVDNDETGHPITNEVYMNMKGGKTTKFLNNLDEDIHKLLYEIITTNYEKGNMPKEFVKSRTITFSKKRTTMKCNNYRTILHFNYHHLQKYYLGW